MKAQSNFETGAKTAASNNLVLSVMNDGAVYGDRLHCAWAMLQGTAHTKSFRDLANNEAINQRLHGSKFKAVDISDAAKIIQATTITECLETLRDNYDKTRNIAVIGRKWRDNVNGNTYFSVSVSVPCVDLGYRNFNIPFQYGYGDQWKHETISVLRKIGVLEKSDKFVRELPINWEFQGVMLKKYMFRGIYI